MKYFSDKAERMAQFIQKAHTNVHVNVSRLQEEINIICFRRDNIDATKVVYSLPNDKFTFGTCADTKDIVMYAAAMCE